MRDCERRRRERDEDDSEDGGVGCGRRVDAGDGRGGTRLTGDRERGGRASAADGGSGGGSGGSSRDERTISMEEEQAKMRNIERQKRLVEDTAKLLELANELKAEVDKSDKNTLSLDVVRKADEIEKLAHSVKERMKGE